MSSGMFGWRDSSRLGLALQAMSIAGSLIFSPAVFAADEHAHDSKSAQPKAEQVIHQLAGPQLWDRMMEEVKKQQEFVNKKGGYASGADSHMMQQGILLVAEDAAKVSVTGDSAARRVLRSRHTASRPSASRSRSVGSWITIPATCTC